MFSLIGASSLEANEIGRLGRWCCFSWAGGGGHGHREGRQIAHLCLEAEECSLMEEIMNLTFWEERRMFFNTKGTPQAEEQHMEENKAQQRTQTRDATNKQK